ncbi:MAG: response regulator [Desulfobacteraceae bacterium]|nr:response regulator [Desulfobacteraceae bacterium]
MAIELVRLIPSILWFFLVVVLLVLLYRPMRDDLLPNLTSLKAGGVQLSFVKDSIDAALKLAEKSPQWKVEVSSEDKERALRRAKKHLQVFRNVWFLWVDDRPENNVNEQVMFGQLKVGIQTARNTDEALEILKSRHFDLVISDMARDDEATAGLKFLEKFRIADKTTPVIFYLGEFDPKKGVPAQAFGITNRPDELLHLTLDALERKKC